MGTKLKNIEFTEDGIYKETYTSSNPRIESVSVKYVGSEDQLNNFLKTVIFDYAKKHKIID